MKMVRVNVHQLTGAALDLAVAKCEGWAWDVDTGEHLLKLVVPGQDHWGGPSIRRRELRELAYSTDWSQGGPIIDREHISTNWLDTQWQANVGFDPESGESDADEAGPTSLVAAMRCYVSWKLGEMVEVPEVLL